MTYFSLVRRRLCGVAIGGLAALFSASALGDSLDCKKTESTVEKMICGDAQLRALDDRLDKLINEIRASGLYLDSDGNFGQWLKTRNRCKTTECITQAYERRIKFLTQWSATEVGKPSINGHYMTPLQGELMDGTRYKTADCLSILPSGPGRIRYRLFTNGGNGHSCESGGYGVWKNGYIKMTDSSGCEFKMQVTLGSIQILPPDGGNGDSCSCRIPCDHLPMRSWPLLRARDVMRGVIESFKAENPT